jgi:hypothetical protein
MKLYVISPILGLLLLTVYCHFSSILLHVSSLEACMLYYICVMDSIVKCSCPFASHENMWGNGSESFTLS